MVFGIICSSNTNIKDIVDNLDYSSIMYDLEIYYFKKNDILEGFFGF